VVLANGVALGYLARPVLCTTEWPLLRANRLFLI
jgi:hypothetical protein